MVRRILAFLPVLGALAVAAAPTGCVGSLAVTSFRLSVQPSGSVRSWIPIHHVNNMLAGSRIRYEPVDLPTTLGKDAKLTLVVVPNASDGQVTVLEPRAAASSTEWGVPFTPRIVLLVFAPQGLDEKRLTNLVTKDDNLVSALADYADQTADLEASLAWAKDLEDQADDDAARPQRASTPAEQAILSLVRAINPAVSSYDPFGAGRRAGPSTMGGKGINTFFENAGGLFPGAGVLPMVKQLLMPDTEFRSVYGLPGDSGGTTLCSQLGPKSRNKLAYIWAYRLNSSAAPATTILKDADVPIGMRVGVPVKLDNWADWHLLDHVFDWTLISDNLSQPPIHVAVRPVPDERALRIDLRKFTGPPGNYRIQGSWDWDTFQPSGVARLHRLDDLKAARIAPDSADKLVAGTGPVDVDLTGADFLFVDRAALHRPSSPRLIPVDLPADRANPADKLRIEVDTDALHPGPYVLALSRVDGATTDVTLQVLPPMPKLDGAPKRVHWGDREQTVTLTGSGLDRLERIESDQADITLGPGNDEATRREITVRLRSGVKAGDRPALSAKIQSITSLIRFPGALQVTAARPKIVEAKLSLPVDLPFAPRDGEVPAGFWVSYAIKTDGVAEPPMLTLQCADASRTTQIEKLHVGEKHPNSQLLSDTAGTLFLSLDPGVIGQSGCALTATVETEVLGKSDAFALGKVVRLPRIESLMLTDERSPEGFSATIKGFDLETIEKTGWQPGPGAAVRELPRPLAGEGAKQTLRITVPWPSPSPKAPLYVWLRGETDGRATKVTQ